MATKGGGGSLLGKADSTLAGGSFREAGADRPADLSKLYQRKSDKFDDFLGMVNEAFDTQTKLDKEIEAETKEILGAAEKNLFSGKIHEGYQDVSFNAVTAAANKIKDFKGDKNSLEFKKMQQKLTRLADVAGQNEEIFTKLTTTKLSSIGSGDDLKLFKQMANDYNNGTNVSNVAYDEKLGDYVFTLEGTDVKKTMSELQDSLSTIDPAGPLASAEILADVAKNVNKREFDNAYQADITNRYKKIFEDSNKKHNIMLEDLPGKDYSLYDAIDGKDTGIQTEIFDALIGAKFDYDGNGADTIEEYNNLTPDNLRKLRNAIKSGPESDGIIAKMMTKYAAQDNYKIGRDLREKNEQESKPKLSAAARQENFLKNQAFNKALEDYKGKSHEPGMTINGYGGMAAKLVYDENEKGTWFVYNKDGRQMDLDFPYTKEPNEGLINFLSGKTKTLK